MTPQESGAFFLVNPLNAANFQRMNSAGIPERIEKNLRRSQLLGCGREQRTGNAPESFVLLKRLRLADSAISVARDSSAWED
jgi:hypothetical protein